MTTPSSATQTVDPRSTTSRCWRSRRRKLGASDFVARSVQFLALRPLRIALIIAVAWLAARVGGALCRRLVRSLQLRAPLLRASERAEARADTVAGALSSLLTAFVWVIATLTVLGELGINLGP